MSIFSLVAGADDVLEPIVGKAAGAPVECPLPNSETMLATEYGAAGFMKNLAETEDSIRAIAVRLLTAAVADTRAIAAAECDERCAAGETRKVVYRVAPIAFLEQAKQNEICLAFEAQTRDNPLRFDPRSFESVADLHEWIMDFSQGRGADGKRLYERCSSNCSPRYTFLIGQRGSGYEVSTEVQCGLARDKSNDQYLISTALRWSCRTQ